MLSGPSHRATPCQVREAVGGSVGLTDATLELFAHIVERLPATPSRFHYLFNLRDLSRVYEGLLRANPDRCVASCVCLCVCAGAGAAVRQGL